MVRFFDSEKEYNPLRAAVAPINGKVEFNSWINGMSSVHVIGNNVCGIDMFFFDAERFGLGQTPHGFADRLNSNAQNLPAVLHTLNGTRGSLFQKLVAHLREIFSTVGNLSVSPTQDNQLEIRVWPGEAMDRVELSFPLNSSGTGVSQVIAIMVAVMTTNNSVIVIDEISSFFAPSSS